MEGQINDLVLDKYKFKGVNICTSLGSWHTMVPAFGEFAVFFKWHGEEVFRKRFREKVPSDFTNGVAVYGCPRTYSIYRTTSRLTVITEEQRPPINEEY